MVDKNIFCVQNCFSEIKNASRNGYTVKTCHRKQKRMMNYLRRKCGFGKYVEDCRYHPSIVTKLHYNGDAVWDGDIDVRSLIDGTTSACSLMLCGIRPLKKEEALRLVEYSKKHGVDAMIEMLHKKDEAAHNIS